MDQATFWQLIDRSRLESEGDRDAQLDILAETLSAMPREEVISFKERLNEAMARAYTWDLIGAAHFIGCGGSDDGFMDFRAWLVSLGRDTFEKIVADAESLVEVPFDDDPLEEWEFEALHMLPAEICEDEEGDDEGADDIPYSDDPDTPAGNPCDDDADALKARFPKLWEHFGGQWMLDNR